ncbi:MAG: GerMN domain-containing protein [Tepidanaerobacteraceae bacterium]|jgi:spore germination protein GerM|nr:GerMN domain-containing protein [Tepidanaerobacteraceae bacterium]
MIKSIKSNMILFILLIVLFSAVLCNLGLAEDQITLYFYNDNMQLIPYSEIKSENPGEVVALILKGPEKFGYCSPIPSNTKLTSFNIKDGIAFLTFSKDFMENTDESVFRPS